MANRGTLVLVVGPSGAGKDSIIRGAKTFYANDEQFVFPRRIVTRKADVSAEDHDSISEMAFALGVAKDDYAVWWIAHGNGYALPISIDDDIREGRTVIFNCSRTVVSEVHKTYPKVVVVDIQVSASHLIERIVARGRESRDEAILRVARVVPPLPNETVNFPIRNDGTLEMAISEFCGLLRMLDDAGSDPRRSPFNDQNQNEYRNDGGGRLVIVK